MEDGGSGRGWHAGVSWSFQACQRRLSGLPLEGKQAGGGKLLEKLLLPEIETSRRNTRASVTKAQLGISPWQQGAVGGEGAGEHGEAAVQSLGGAASAPDPSPEWEISAF